VTGRSVIRLSGGEILIDQATAALLNDLLVIALNARRDLLTARSTDDLDRVRRLRDLAAALEPGCAPGCELETAQPADAGPQAPSTRLMSVREAAQVHNVSEQAIRKRLADGRLDGEQDAPGRPWRIRHTEGG
jgi:excisionase family DNA binding protein